MASWERWQRIEAKQFVGGGLAWVLCLPTSWVLRSPPPLWAMSGASPGKGTGYTEELGARAGGCGGREAVALVLALGSLESGAVRPGRGMEPGDPSCLPCACTGVPLASVSRG